ncbi:MAG: putative lipid II flippase FtsW [Deltaproteobacteria bacterium]|nr:putative lipid II flippase FtsW [Deltaproteobacteria bacterium]
MAKAKTKGKAGKLSYDLTILVPVLLLLAVGLVLVYSSSNHLAEHRLGDSYFYLKRQVLFCLIGVTLMLLAKHIPYTLYAKLAYPLLAVSLGFLILLHIPGVGHTVNHACRWLRVGGFSFQPSELAKFSLCIYLAYSMAKKATYMDSFSRGLAPHLVIAGVFMLLIAMEPDFGTAAIIGAWVLTLLFVGGARFRYLLVIFAVLAALSYWMIRRADYRIERLLAFFNPWEDPAGIGYQIIHSFLAFGSGGIFGAGLGASKQKLFYLPEPHTDFILSIAAEELGLVGVAVIVAVFGFLIYRGLRVALEARDLFATYLALGLMFLLGLQVVINMAVVMGLLPTKGLSLPLISYGGSSLIINLAGIGILLNIASRNR